ncbi:MAG: ABC transporter permease [Gammaproteobacteria bacterium]|nr:ABC transporter permease [Gammaproteobacteria bacterium]
MNAVTLPLTAPNRASGESLWHKAARKFGRDRLGMLALGVVLAYFLVALGAWLGWWAGGWADLTGTKWEPVSSAHWFGTNIIGQDIFDRAVFSTATAFEVGLSVALAATFIGAVFGAFAGFFVGSWIDEFLLWCMGVLDAIPFYLFVAAVAYALTDNPWAMQVAMIATFWVGTGRLIRGEVIKLRGMEYVEAAHSIGVSELAIIFRHILPNTGHILLVQASITFVSAIKAEVILSFLGLGIKDGMSWGLMIDESTKEVLAGFYNNFLAASLLMFGLVMAFNAVADALQDALDPRKVG